jgi:hypothetical protein
MINMFELVTHDYAATLLMLKPDWGSPTGRRGHAAVSETDIAPLPLYGILA